MSANWVSQLDLVLDLDLDLEGCRWLFSGSCLKVCLPEGLLTPLSLKTTLRGGDIFDTLEEASMQLKLALEQPQMGSCYDGPTQL